MYRSFFKPLFDRLFALLALIVLSPVLLVVAITVRIKLGSPVIFSQIRPGKDEKPFKLYKFRSMTNDKDALGNILPSRERLTKFGHILRLYSLDELPELLNILKGEMSFVGPRPLLVEYLSHYSKEQRRRHNVRPGLTGWAQVNGRNTISWEKRFDLDVEYVDNLTLRLDFKIFILTLRKVFYTDEVTPIEGSIMEPFYREKSDGI